MNESSENRISGLEIVAQHIREQVIEMFHGSGRGHIGGSLSVIDILVALYFDIMRVDPKNPDWPDRDRLVLSKGHASAAWYAVLAERGFFSKDILFTQFIKLNGILQEHSEMRKIPGVDMSSGSLAQGLSVALGMSLAARVTGRNYKAYVVMSDAEMQSGQVWEAMMACSHYKAKNIIGILDYNKLQVSDFVENIMSIEPIRKKFEAFGWRVLEVNGHDMAQLLKGLEVAGDNSTPSPTMLICHTTKGKGVPFMEGRVEWHANIFSEEDYQRAKRELAECAPKKVIS